MGPEDKSDSLNITLKIFFFFFDLRQPKVQTIEAFEGV